MSARSPRIWFVICGSPAARHAGGTERPTPSTKRPPLSACSVVDMLASESGCRNRKCEIAVPMLDVRGRLGDRPAEHSDVLGAVPLADPDRAEAEMLGHLRLPDRRPRIGDPPGQACTPRVGTVDIDPSLIALA